MKAQINISAKTAILVDLEKPISISIPINEGNENPNCYWADSVKFETIKADGFVGSVALGGPVNYQKLQLTPHGNGTHTEGYGHLTNSGVKINNQLKSYHFYSKLITVIPIMKENGDSVVELTNELIHSEWDNYKALIIRTMPNNESKLTRNYSGTNPTYMAAELIDFIVSKGIKHLLIDLPSVDKEVDDGKLLAHRAFWKLPNNPRKNTTITELIFVSDTIVDDNYLLNLQTINLAMDAAPSNPILYKIEKVLSITS